MTTTTKKLTAYQRMELRKIGDALFDRLREGYYGEAECRKMAVNRRGLARPTIRAMTEAGYLEAEELKDGFLTGQMLITDEGLRAAGFVPDAIPAYIAEGRDRQARETAEYERQQQERTEKWERLTDALPESLRENALRSFGELGALGIMISNDQLETLAARILELEAQDG